MNYVKIYVDNSKIKVKNNIILTILIIWLNIQNTYLQIPLLKKYIINKHLHTFSKCIIRKYLKNISFILQMYIKKYL